MGAVSDPRRAQTSPCRAYKLEGGVNTIAWSPGVKGSLRKEQLQAPLMEVDGVIKRVEFKPNGEVAGRLLPHYNPFDSPPAGRARVEEPEGGRPKPGAKIGPDGEIYNPGLCPWVDLDASPVEMVKFFDCQADRADECDGKSSGLKGEARGDAFGQCLSRAMPTCDAIIAPGPPRRPGERPEKPGKEKAAKAPPAPPAVPVAPGAAPGAPSAAPASAAPAPAAPAPSGVVEAAPSALVAKARAARAQREAAEQAAREKRFGTAKPAGFQEPKGAGVASEGRGLSMAELNRRIAEKKETKEG